MRSTLRLACVGERRQAVRSSPSAVLAGRAQPISPTQANRAFSVLLLALVVLVASSSTQAHHSFAAQYDANQPVTLVGTVTKIEWTNPHARFYVDVKDDKGVVTNWNLELGSPNVLRRNGWARTSLNVGDEVTVEGSLARDGSKMANARVVKLADGRTVFAGSSGGDAAPPSQGAKP